MISKLHRTAGAPQRQPWINLARLLAHALDQLGQHGPAPLLVELCSAAQQHAAGFVRGAGGQVVLNRLLPALSSLEKVGSAGVPGRVTLMITPGPIEQELT